MKTLMYLYHTNDAGGVELKNLMGLQQIKHEGSRFKAEKDTIVINWGSSKPKNQEMLKCKIINTPEAVGHAVDKIKFLQAASQVANCVPWTTSRWIAQLWIDRGDTVYCRTKIKGKEGNGIIVTKGKDLPEAPLYTLKVDSIDEYRVHVVDGKVIAVHRKVEGEDPSIRNSANGWKFKKIFKYPFDLEIHARAATKAVGLDFAAIDILWDGKKATVLEANTAPGIEGMNATLKAYADALKELAREKQ